MKNKKTDPNADLGFWFGPWRILDAEDLLKWDFNHKPEPPKNEDRRPKTEPEVA